MNEIQELDNVRRKIQKRLKEETSVEWKVYFRIEGWNWSFMAENGSVKYLSPSYEFGRDLPLSDNQVEYFVVHCKRHLDHKLEQMRAWQT